MLQNIFGLPNLKSWVWHSNNFSFQMKRVKDDLMRLVHRLDNSDDDAFTDATGPIDPKRQVTYEAVPNECEHREVFACTKDLYHLALMTSQIGQGHYHRYQVLTWKNFWTQKLKLQQAQGLLLRHSWWPAAQAVMVRSRSHVPSSNRVTKK